MRPVGALVGDVVSSLRRVIEQPPPRVESWRWHRCGAGGGCRGQAPPALRMMGESMTLATFIQASAHLLDGIADGSVQAIVTSPPYYGLRRYFGDQDVDWPAVDYAPMPGLPPLTVPAMRSPLGNEPTLEAYIGHLILCLRRWREVLRMDGCCFVNLGDSYAANRGSGSKSVGAKQATNTGANLETLRVPSGLKEKDLMMVPARFALAAQADGWWLRSDIIGAKIAPMPESVTDRPTRSHEHIFMLTKASRYFWDADAVRDEKAESTLRDNRTNDNGHRRERNFPGAPSNGGTNLGGSVGGRNMRDVIEWRPSPFPGAHFAVWPEAIPEKLIRASTSERGACPHCGSPWRRVVERTNEIAASAKGSRFDHGKTGINGNGRVQEGERYEKVATGWQPSCTCPPHEPVPCVVLDPFSGSGTTAKVAVRLGRRAIGVDIAAEYLDDVTALRFGAGVQMELTGTL